jgi:hypothetical protein
MQAEKAIAQFVVEVGRCMLVAHHLGNGFAKHLFLKCFTFPMLTHRQDGLHAPINPFLAPIPLEQVDHPFHRLRFGVCLKGLLIGRR